MNRRFVDWALYRGLHKRYFDARSVIAKARWRVRRAQWQWPWITKKRHRELMARVVEDHKRTLGRKNEELEQTAAMVDELLPRLARVNIDKNPSDRLFRIVITFDEYLIQQSFVWGNEDREIRFIAERMAYDIARELIGINKSRLIRDRYR